VVIRVSMEQIRPDQMEPRMGYLHPDVKSTGAEMLIDNPTFEKHYPDRGNCADLGLSLGDGAKAGEGAPDVIRFAWGVRKHIRSTVSLNPMHAANTNAFAKCGSALLALFYADAGGWSRSVSVSAVC